VEVRREFGAAFDAALAAESVSSWAAATASEFTPMSAGELRARIRSQRAILSRYRNVIAVGH
jgi:hypothetical protein